MNAEGSPTATSIILNEIKSTKRGGPNQNPQRKKKGVK
jgi:hypothetical protein